MGGAEGLTNFPLRKSTESAANTGAQAMAGHQSSSKSATNLFLVFCSPSDLSSTIQSICSKLSFHCISKLIRSYTKRTIQTSGTKQLDFSYVFLAANLAERARGNKTKAKEVMRGRTAAELGTGNPKQVQEPVELTNMNIAEQVRKQVIFAFSDLSEWFDGRSNQAEVQKRQI
jgi:hypothetical protein